MPARYVCIHGHFYQPPRENPWLESVEQQDSARPFHDWNARITAECYGPNAAARILDREGYIRRIVSNYARISFNFGPTLLAWMETQAPEAYAAIIEADRRSAGVYSGHGSALAQVYNHLIMPLANARDQRTQVRWGIADFERRFGRRPHGMWLAETAADVPSLEALAEAGVRFTVLAPHQAKRVRPLATGKAELSKWEDVNGNVDTRQPYRCNLPSGRTIDLFFYDGAIARSVAFDHLLDDGERFVDRIVAGFDDRDGPQLVHIATDGETYGHHHRHGEMALAYALDTLEARGIAVITNYGEHLSRFPPTYEAEIVEQTSWSCAHGIERWQSDCGCTSSGPEWSQDWRGPLRAALDWLRDELAELFEASASSLFGDPWAARDAFIDVVLDRSPSSLDGFLAANAKANLDPPSRVLALQLLEMQRHLLLMFTSCGWFFDELSRIEAVQILRYAGRAIQLAQDMGGGPYEEAFLVRLAEAKSNLVERGDGRQIYETEVRPAMVDLPKLVAHYAACGLLGVGDSDQVYAYRVKRRHYESRHAGRAKLAVGCVDVTSRITTEQGTLSFCVLHLGDHNLSGGVRPFVGDDAYQAMADDVIAEFERGDLPEVVRVLDHKFGALTYSLRSLFAEEQRQIIGELLQETLVESESLATRLYKHHWPQIAYAVSLGHELPGPMRAAVDFMITAGLSGCLSAERVDLDQAQRLLADATRYDVKIDAEAIGYALDRVIDRLTRVWEAQPFDEGNLEELHHAVVLAQSLPFVVDLWRLQNVYHSLQRTQTPPESCRVAFARLGEALQLRLG